MAESTDIPKKLVSSIPNLRVILYDAQRLAPVHKLNFHAGAIKHIQPMTGHPHLLLSAAADSCVAMWDLRTAGAGDGPVQRIAALVPSFRQPRRGQDPFAVLTADVNGAGQVLAAGTNFSPDFEEAILALYDLRQVGQGPVRQYVESHGEDITQAKFHPLQSGVLRTGSEDGLVCLFDLNQECEDDAVTAVGNTESSVNLAGWFGPSAEYVYAASPFDNFTLWGIRDDGLDLIHRWADTRQLSGPECLTDYIVDCHYNPHSQRLFLTTGSNKGQIQNFHVGMGDLRLCQALDGGHSEVVRAVLWSPDQSVLISGGEDAQLSAWTSAPPPPESEMAASTSTQPLWHESAGSTSSARNPSRFRPY
ncbi:hypothetical protein IWQ60_003713 [Tieghemiomyces parasiticus]|uniref:WD repeat-containing protein 89 n=1 Tax=Tieghemiomyces parasiticus TaxID=78921 RepID=A0A9W8AAA0_9FUNG|nr:hypothetical protein IWQ60_003713 [Tieghemiomyces parasiticus]